MEGRERGEEGERGGRKGEGEEGEGRSLPYQSKNGSRAPDCLCIALCTVAVIGLRFCLLRCSTVDKCTNDRKGPGYLERKFHGTKVPWNERSRERMF